jgi:hypothetical protein
MHSTMRAASIGVEKAKKSAPHRGLAVTLFIRIREGARRTGIGII